MKKLSSFGAKFNGDEYVLAIHTKEANFKDLSILLSCLKIIEQKLVKQMLDIEPDFELDNEEVQDNN